MIFIPPQLRRGYTVSKFCQSVAELFCLKGLCLHILYVYGLFLWYLTPLSTIFQLYHGGQFYYWRKPPTFRKSLTRSNNLFLAQLAKGHVSCTYSCHHKFYRKYLWKVLYKIFSFHPDRTKIWSPWAILVSDGLKFKKSSPLKLGRYNELLLCMNDVWEVLYKTNMATIGNSCFLWWSLLAPLNLFISETARTR